MNGRNGQPALTALSFAILMLLMQENVPDAEADFIGTGEPRFSAIRPWSKRKHACLLTVELMPYLT